MSFCVLGLGCPFQSFASRAQAYAASQIAAHPESFISKALLIAAYETKRMLVLTTFANNPKLVLPALAYAYDCRLAPIFHEGVAREMHGVDPFEDVYPVKREFMTSVAKFVDDRWIASDFDGIAFTKIEDEFGGYKMNRLEIASTLRYAFLSSRFDETVYAAIKKSAPSEAFRITSRYGPEDVSFE